MVEPTEDYLMWGIGKWYITRNDSKVKIVDIGTNWVKCKSKEIESYFCDRNSGKSSLEDAFDIVEGPVSVIEDNNTGRLSGNAGRLSWSEDSPYKDFNYPSKDTSKLFTSALKTQIGGSHYADNPIQPIEFIGRNNLSFTVGNIIKYAVRADKKNGKEDLKKCIHYAQIELELKYGVKSKVEYDDN